MVTRRSFIHDVALTATATSLMPRAFSNGEARTAQGEIVSFFIVGDTHYCADWSDVSILNEKALIAFPLLVGLVLSRERSISVSIRTMELTIVERLFFTCICWKRVFKLGENGEFMIAKARNEDRDRAWDVFFKMSVDRKIFLLRLEDNEKEVAERFSESLNHIAYGETVSIIG